MYRYFVHPAGTPLKEVDGNYIYAKKNAEGLWVPVYIGQGNLADRSDLTKHHKGACIRVKGATHIHAHINADETERQAEEDDLLANYTQAYKPVGCNEKIGG